MARFEAHSRDVIECAAQAGMPDALCELGLMYCSGRDVQLDMIEAHKWFNLAALRGNADAVRLRREIAEQMSEVEIASAQRAARAWLKAN